MVKTGPDAFKSVWNGLKYFKLYEDVLQWLFYLYKCIKSKLRNWCMATIIGYNLKFKQPDTFDSMLTLPHLHDIIKYSVAQNTITTYAAVCVGDFDTYIWTHIKWSPTTGHRFRHFCNSINVKYIYIYIQIIINLGQLMPAQSIVIATIFNNRGIQGG